MRHRSVADLMTPTAVSVVPGTTFKEIVEDVVTHTLRLSPPALSVEVADGRVTLSGTVRRRSLVPVLLRLCNSVDGVVGVVDRLTYEDDDLSRK
ncbi:BON domain-containing protein [Streptomyces sp. NPDC051822]|uniref:BON domain-containing protein n=1 Tax=Streptomyces sp. NPDC051822 TaxID=3365675 RepID=UPI0037B5C43E